MDPLKRLVTDERGNKVIAAFDLLRLMDREIPGQLVVAFLYIGSHNPCHKLALEEDLGLTPSSASRLIAWLSDYHRLGKPGLGLVVKEKDYSNMKRVMVKLTPKGDSLFKKFMSCVYG